MSEWWGMIGWYVAYKECDAMMSQARKELRAIFVMAIVGTFLLGAFAPVARVGPGEVREKVPSAIPGPWTDIGSEPAYRTRVIPNEPDFNTPNQDGNNFIEITADDTPVFQNFVGTMFQTFNLSFTSLKWDDGVETNGDDILWNVTARLLNDPGMMYYELPNGSLVPLQQVGYVNPIQGIGVGEINYNFDPAHNYGAIYGGSGGKYVPNMGNTWVDENNDGLISPGEVWQVNNGPLTFSGFEINISGDAEPGYYVLPVEVTYQYNEYVPVAPNGVTNWWNHGLGGGVNMFDYQGDDYLGDFLWYWWIPYNKTSGGAPTFGESPQGGPTYVTHNRENISFKKIWPYDANHLLDYSQIDGTDKAYNRSNLSGADWYAIRDDGRDDSFGWPQDTTPFVYLNGSWDDGNASDEDWIHGGVAGGNIEAIWQNFINYVAPWTGWTYPNDVTIDRTPTLNGNGTWNYTGYLPDIVWHNNSNVSTEVEYFFIRILSSGADPASADNEPSLTITPTTPTTGETFEAWTLTFHNYDGVAMQDTYFNLTPPEGFELYGGYDSVFFGDVAPDSDANVTWRIDTPQNLTPGTYRGSVMVEYDKEYTSTTHHHGTTTVLQHVTEEIPVTFFVDYTPSLTGSIVPSMRMRAIPTPELTINNTVGLVDINVSIENNGNTRILNGPDDLDNVQMNFAIFSKNGESVTDSDGNVYVAVDETRLPELDVGESTYRNIEVKIDNPHSLAEGLYQLNFDIYGFYYDNLTETPVAGYVAFAIKWETGASGHLEARLYRDITDTLVYPDPNWMDDETPVPVDGLSVPIYIQDFFDPANGLRKMPEITYANYQTTITQGTDTTATVSVDITNTGNAPMEDVYATLLINELDAASGGTFLAGENYYEGDNPIMDDPTSHVDFIAPGQTVTLTFTINGINPNIPPGLHRIPVEIRSAYYDGRWLDDDIADYNPDDPANDDYSAYNILWDTTALPATPYEDKNENGVTDPGDTMLEDAPIIDIIVNDDKPDLKVVYAGGDPLYLGDPYSGNGALIDRKIDVDITNLELYDLTNVEVEMECGHTTPILNPVDHNATTVAGVFAGMNTINSGATVRVTFTVDINKEFEPGAYNVVVRITKAMNGDTYDIYEYPAVDMSYDVPVRLLPTPPILVVTDYSVDGTVAPGQEFTLSVKVENKGDDTARNVFFTLGAEMYNDDAFDLIDAFVSSISSAEYNIDLDGDGSPDGPYVVSKQTNVTLADIGIDNVSDIMYAERMLKDPSAKISTIYLSELGPGGMFVVNFTLRMDINAMEGREYVEDFYASYEDLRGVQRENGPYPVIIKTQSEGQKVWPGLEPEAATKEDLKGVSEDLKKSTQEGMNNAMLFAGILFLVLLVIVLLVFMYMIRRGPPTVTEEAVEGAKEVGVEEPVEKEIVPMPGETVEGGVGEAGMEEEIPSPPGLEEEALEEGAGEEEELPPPPEFEEEGTAEETVEEEEEEWSLGGEEEPPEIEEGGPEEGGAEEEGTAESEEAVEVGDEEDEEWSIGEDDLTLDEEKKEE